MDQLLSLRLFCRVAARGSFSAAARDLGMTQPAASRGILELERRLGLRLFERSTRRVVLTAEGRRYKEQVEEPLRALEDADVKARSGFGELAGRVKLSAPAALGRRLLLPEILRLLDEAPGLRIETSFTDRRVDLVGGEYDFSFRVGRRSEHAWVERPLGNSEQWFVAAPTLFDGGELPESLEALRGLPVVIPGAVDRFEPFDFDVRLVTDDLEAALVAVRSGAFVSVLPRWLVSQDVASGALARLLPRVDLGGAPIVAVHAKRLRRVARHVLDTLGHRIAGLLQTITDAKSP
jgi:DNA-binding transcriptional LysR family regulator